MPTFIADAPYVPDALILILFPFLFVGLWCFVCFRISQLGWSDWAKIYRCDRKLQGKFYHGRSGKFSIPGSYKRILNVVLSNEGIGLSVSFPWRVGHPPLLLPWNKVIAVEDQRLLLHRTLRISISDMGRTFTFGLPLSAKPEFETRTPGLKNVIQKREL